MDGSILNTTRTSAQSNVRQSRVLLGMGLAALAMFLFASQDAITKTLVQQMPISTVLITRYTAFAIFATVLAALTMKGGLKAAVQTNNLWGQCFRGVILVGEIFVFSWGVTIYVPPTANASQHRAPRSQQPKRCHPAPSPTAARPWVA